MLEIIPGILEKDWNEIERKIELIRPFAKSIHIDIIDGKFAPNTTFLDPQPFTKYAKDFILELHMMVEDPIQYLKPWANAGFQRFIAQIEKMPSQEEFVAEAQLWGEVGLALDGPTPLNTLKVPLDDLDNILIMTIKAGFSGQAYNAIYLQKVQKLKEEILRGVYTERSRSAQNDRVIIEVDGGINDQTIIQARDTGATRFAATSFIYKGENPLLQYETLVNSLKKSP